MPTHIKKRKFAAFFTQNFWFFTPTRISPINIQKVHWIIHKSLDLAIFFVCLRSIFCKFIMTIPFSYPTYTPSKYVSKIIFNYFKIELNFSFPWCNRASLYATNSLACFSRSFLFLLASSQLFFYKFPPHSLDHRLEKNV